MCIVFDVLAIVRVTVRLSILLTAARLGILGGKGQRPFFFSRKFIFYNGNILHRVADVLAGNGSHKASGRKNSEALETTAHERSVEAMVANHSQRQRSACVETAGGGDIPCELRSRSNAEICDEVAFQEAGCGLERLGA